MQTDLRRAVFFDRDGTLMEDAHYCGDPALVKVFPGVPAALRRLKEAGLCVLVITNQSGIGRGLITEAQYRSVQEEFLRQVGRESIDASYYCPDAPDVPSKCRKPEPGMVLAAVRQHGRVSRDALYKEFMTRMGYTTFAECLNSLLQANLIRVTAHADTITVIYNAQSLERKVAGRM